MNWNKKMVGEVLSLDSNVRLDVDEDRAVFVRFANGDGMFIPANDGTNEFNISSITKNGQRELAGRILPATLWIWSRPIEMAVMGMIRHKIVDHFKAAFADFRRKFPDHDFDYLCDVMFDAIKSQCVSQVPVSDQEGMGIAYDEVCAVARMILRANEEKQEAIT